MLLRRRRSPAEDDLQKSRSGARDLQKHRTGLEFATHARFARGEIEDGFVELKMPNTQVPPCWQELGR
jgi:hypothetical protein